MFDSRLRPLIDPPLDRLAAVVGRLGATPNMITIGGLGLGALAALAIVVGLFTLALVFVALNRLADGLDGALARRQGSSQIGGYYDIVFDFFFYGAVPLAFALNDPPANALAAAVLLASFYANGATFLAFASVAAARGLTTSVQGKKTIYYFAGLAEGAETIAVFVLMCLFPQWFFAIALAFSIICFLSAGVRVVEVTALLNADGGEGMESKEPA